MALGSASYTDELILELEDSPYVSRIAFALDNDETGINRTKSLIDRLKSMNNLEKKYAVAFMKADAKDLDEAINLGLESLEEIYKNGKKTITRKLVNRLDKRAIAIWYMDDGSLSNRKDKNGTVTASVLTLYTCTTKENNQIIIDYFDEVWGIKFGQNLNTFVEQEKQENLLK